MQSLPLHTPWHQIELFTERMQLEMMLAVMHPARRGRGWWGKFSLPGFIFTFRGLREAGALQICYLFFCCSGSGRHYKYVKVWHFFFSCHTFGAPSAADGVTITSSGAVSRCEARASNSVKFPILVSSWLPWISMRNYFDLEIYVNIGTWNITIQVNYSDSLDNGNMNSWIVSIVTSMWDNFV